MSQPLANTPLQKKTPNINSQPSGQKLSVLTNQNYSSKCITPKITSLDRFIPNRWLNDLEASNHLITKCEKHEKYDDSSESQGNRNTNANNNETNELLFTGKSKLNASTQTKILHLTNGSGSYLTKDEIFRRNLSENFMQYTSVTKLPKRRLPVRAELILDAPNVMNDFYLNLLDWSSTGKLTVALHDDVFVWDQYTKTSSRLFSLSSSDDSLSDIQDSITSIKWMNNGNVIAVGTSENSVLFWDVNQNKCIYSFNEHNSRVGTLAWNGSLLTSGSKEGTIYNHDIRMKSKVSTYQMHKKEVCGLKWNPSGRFLCSGGDDNKVAVWDILSNATNDNSQLKPLHTFNAHNAAVKGIDWCPWQSNILATGGGIFDGSIKIWNIYNGNQIKNVKTESQISGLIFSDKNHELLSSHGDTENNMIVWKYPKMDVIGELKGHVSRILSITLSPNGQIVVSLSADQTLRFWECFKIENMDKLICNTPLSTRILNQTRSIR